MSSIWKHQRRLTAAGEKEVGHIFTTGYVPLTQYTPVYANLRGLGKSLVFLVDWNGLTEEEQEQCLFYISEKNMGVSPDVIRSDIEADGYFPIQHKYILESYSMRYFT